MNNADMQPKLFLAAAAAKEFADSKVVAADPFCIELWIALQSKIQDVLELALTVAIPVEDAILYLNQISGKETAVGEPKFDYGPTCGSLPEMEGIF